MATRNAVERHRSEEGEARDAALYLFDVAVEQSIRCHKRRCPTQEPGAGEPYAAGLERLLEQVKGQHGDE